MHESVAARAGSLISARRAPRPLRPLRVSELARHAAPPLLFAVVVIGGWQLYAVLSGVHSSTLPRPTQVASALFDDRDLLLSNGWTTLTEILLGYATAVIVGTGLAALISFSRTVQRALYPWLVISQTIPIPAIAPLFVIWTGFDIRPKLIVIALTTFFPIAVNTIDGLRSADPELLDLLRTLGAGPLQRFRIAQLPAAMPFIFSGLKVAAALSVIGAVFAEWVGSSSGLGNLILTFNNQTATARMFAAVVALSLIGVVLFFAVAGLERLALPWYQERRPGP